LHPDLDDGDFSEADCKGALGIFTEAAAPTLCFRQGKQSVSEIDQAPHHKLDTFTGYASPYPSKKWNLARGIESSGQSAPSRLMREAKARRGGEGEKGGAAPPLTLSLSPRHLLVHHIAMFYILVNHFVAGQVLYYAMPELCFDFVARYFVFPLLSYLGFEALLAWVSSQYRTK
jgi:hypothetical protein